ncbi:MAG: CDP-alcohol phosphatidyltransferase, partial [Bacillota bacterium]|nr:CDP-alcohol phosphatidyltransferase [Bacillota bacterium]
VVSYCIGFYKYRTFASLHTYANKATGALIFAFPLFYILFGLTGAGIILCFAGFISSFEELVIIVKSKKLNRDCKSIIMQ